MKSKRFFDILYIVMLIVVLTGFLIMSFQKSACQSKFGSELNERRKLLKIPILPGNWLLKQKEDNSTTWISGQIVPGHNYKMVIYNGCELDQEEDHYYFNFEIVGGRKVADKLLTVNYKYVNSRRNKDSLMYTYQQSNRVIPIINKQADSLFAAYKIRRDF